MMSFEWCDFQVLSLTMHLIIIDSTFMDFNLQEFLKSLIVVAPNVVFFNEIIEFDVDLAHADFSKEERQAQDQE